MEPFQVGAFLTAGVLIVTGLWALLMMDNILKKIIGANLIGDGVNLVLIGIDYRPEDYSRGNGTLSCYSDTINLFPFTRIWCRICK